MLSRYVASQVKHNSFFLAGLALGLWAALALVPLEEAPACGGGARGPGPAPLYEGPDEFTPVREPRPLGPGPAPARSVQRPRYYSTELGMKGRLLAGVLTSAEALGGRARALNATAGRLQPALRFFMAARRAQREPAPGNVVGFTDTREMLKPFHALKYLADNYLDEYDFFFLVSDASYVNARALLELAGGLSGGRDVYMGAAADDDSHYCTLDGGILLSRSVLRAVHAELDWCVRNSYSPRHHENIGRCVLHAAGARCAARRQGREHRAAPAAAAPALAAAVAAHPVPAPEDFHRLHAYVARTYLERDREETRRLRAYVWSNAARHPRHYRNATWPGGLRGAGGLAAPVDNRFDHLRWTSFNATHAFLLDDRRAVDELAGVHKRAVQSVLEEVEAWARRRWGAAGEAGAQGPAGAGARGPAAVELVEGAWCWEPARALRYRLLLRLRGPEQRGALRLVEALRPLGGARLVPAPYVTEGGRVWLVLPVAGPEREPALAWLRRYRRTSLAAGANTALVLALVRRSPGSEAERAALDEVRAALAALAAQHPAAALLAVDAAAGAGAGARAALEAALAVVPRDALVLLAAAHCDYGDEFLNRVRMNTIPGVQWYLPLPFARFAQYSHPRFLDAEGRKPTVNTGRFNERAAPSVAAFSRRDYERARSEAGVSGAGLSVPALLARSPLRCLRAPEPALVLAPPAAPCQQARERERRACLSSLRAASFAGLELGAPASLARLILESQAAVAG